MRVFGQKFAYIRRGSQGANSLHVFSKQTDYSFQHCPDSPSGVPFLWMVLSDCETYFGIGLKSAVFVHEYDIWRFERVFVREQDLSVIESFVKFCVFWTLYCEMPVVNVVR